MTNHDIAVRLAEMNGSLDSLIRKARDRDAKTALRYLSRVLDHMVEDLGDDTVPTTKPATDKARPSTLFY
ncbi:MAG: hypothetical protein HRU31_14420 [Rhodobacteraceae bacterium]|nr:hypothetical protein [Paracoccaceae bacterium]